MNRRSLVHAVTLLALLATAPAAGAEVLSARLSDDSFDAGSAGRDITGGAVSYDTSGRA